MFLYEITHRYIYYTFFDTLKKIVKLKEIVIVK